MRVEDRLRQSFAPGLGRDFRSAVMQTPQPPLPSGISLHPFSVDVLRDPYVPFARLRAGGGTQFAEDLGVWVVSRDEEVRAVLADAESFSNAMTIAPVMPVCPQAGQILGGLTVDTPTAARDGQAHVQARRALAATFPLSPRKAAAWEPAIRAIADDLIDAILARGEADLVSQFAWEFSVRVILDVVGVPREANERIKRWTDGRFGIVWGSTTEAEQIRIANDTVSFWEYCQELVAARVQQPREDLMSALIAYRAEDGAALSEREVASLAFDLLNAGHETVANMVSNGVLRLLTTDGWAKLVAEPERISPALEEILRFDTPTPGWFRMTTRPVRIGDAEIAAGERILLLIGSANRDERRWPDGDSFDIARPDADEHVSFSIGRHFCPGAALARLEGRVALRALTERLPALRLRDGFEPSYVPNMAFRMLETLPVTCAVAP
jgi:cytochrome P450